MLNKGVKNMIAFIIIFCWLSSVIGAYILGVMFPIKIVVVKDDKKN